MSDATLFPLQTIPVTIHEYDAAGELTKYTDRSGRVTEYGYDHLLRRTSETWKDGQTTEGEKRG